MKISASTMKPTDLTLRELACAYFRLNENEAASQRQQELRAKIIAQVLEEKKEK
jgi:hypothetical protein